MQRERYLEKSWVAFAIACACCSCAAVPPKNRNQESALQPRKENSTVLAIVVEF